MIKINSFLDKPLNKFILWFALGMIIFLVGITRPKADTYYLSYADVQQYYDNRGSSVSAVTSTWNESLQSYISNNIYTVANSYGAGVSFNSPISLIDGHTYTLSIFFPQRNNIAVSSKPNISIGYSLSNASSKYVSGNYSVSLLSYMVANNSTLQYVFKPTTNATYIFLPFTTTSSLSQNYNMTQVVIDDLGPTGVTQNEINSSLNNQTNIINNSISSSEANLRSAINQSTEDISNSIDLSNYNCMKETTKKDFHFGKDKYVENNGTLRPASNYYYTTDFIRVTGFTITFSGINGNNYHLTFFDKDYNIIGSGTILQSTTYNLPSNTYYIKFSLLKDNYNNFTLTSDNCIYVDKNISTDNAITDVNDTLNDDDTTGATGEASDFFSNFNSNTFGLTSIITAPLNLIQSLTSQTCTALHLPLPYLNNKYLDLPCMSSIYSQFFGSFFTLYQTITFGIVAYWVCVRIFNQVKDFKNPEHDEIEVLDL